MYAAHTPLLNWAGALKSRVIAVNVVTGDKGTRLQPCASFSLPLKP